MPEQPPPTSSIDYVIAYAGNQVWSGPLNGTLERVGESGGLPGPEIEAIVMVDPNDAQAKAWAVDGTRSIIVDLSNDTLPSWSSRVLTQGAGVLPQGCALAAVFSGRAVLARQVANASIWYMSRVANPLDWDFGAEPLATSAIAGTDPAVGVPADAITALAPFGEDYLIFGCQSSIWAMIGDPGYGGRLFALTRETGMVGPRAWTFDGTGRLYFLGQGGAWVMNSPTSRPENISGRRLIGVLDRLDVFNTHVELAYDAFRGEVHWFLTPKDGSAGTHAVYTVADEAWWLDSYPANIGPWAAAGSRGDVSQDRRVLMGGNDGYVRRHDDDALLDDGAGITARIDFAPIEFGGGMIESFATELQPFALAGGGPADWSWHVAPSPDEVAALPGSPPAPPAASGTLFSSGGGYQRPIGLRVCGGAHKLRLSVTTDEQTTASFAIERMLAVIEPAGRRR